MKLNNEDESIVQMWSPEHEHYGTFFLSGPVSNQFQLGNMLVIPQGFTTMDRLGKKISLDAIHIQGTIKCSSTAEPFNRFYFAIIYDKFPTGTLPNATNVFQDNGAYGREFREMAHSHRYVILYKRNFSLIGKSGGDYTDNSQVWFQDYIQVNLPTIFKDNGIGDINDVEQGALYFVYSGEPLATVDVYDIYIGARTYFTDF